MVGCLYDNGPHVADEHDAAVNDLCETFIDLEEAELLALRDALEKHGIYHFESPGDAGADYAEITECDCEEPDHNT